MKMGEAASNPYKSVHTVKNPTMADRTKVLGFLILDKGQPLTVPIKVATRGILRDSDAVPRDGLDHNGRACRHKSDAADLREFDMAKVGEASTVRISKNWSFLRLFGCQCDDMARAPSDHHRSNLVGIYAFPQLGDGIVVGVSIVQMTAAQPCEPQVQQIDEAQASYQKGQRRALEDHP